MSRKASNTCQSPWVAQIDSVEIKLMDSSEVGHVPRQTDVATHVPLNSGWLSCRAKYWIDRLTQLSETLQTSTVTGKQCSDYEVCQQLLQQSMPTLQRLNQRAGRASDAASCDQQEDAVAVALRAASKQRASQRK